MQTTITGFHQDDARDWVAELACGHTQHMRHAPPWQERAWVLQDDERARRIGQEIACPLCDMPELPEGVAVYKRTPSFDQDSVPAALLAEHTTKAGVWARIVVESGVLEYSFGTPHRSFELRPGRFGIVVPEVPHRVALRGAVRFHVEFLRAP